LADEASDRELAERVLRDGDEVAFRALYRRHTPYLLQFSLRILGGARADAEDVVQEAWIRATSNLDGFRWESAFRTWISGIALNRARDRLRSNGRELQAEAPIERSRPPASVPDRIDLERAIAELPEGFRLVLVLHDIEGYTHAEIGERLGTEPASSRSQLSRARSRLRALLTPAAAT